MNGHRKRYLGPSINVDKMLEQICPLKGAIRDIVSLLGVVVFKLHVHHNKPAPCMS